MDIQLVIIIFLLFLYLTSENKCSAYRPAHRDYTYEGSIDSTARQVFPDNGRTHSVFKYQSPESWPFQTSPETKMSIPRRGRVTAIPTVPETAAPETMEQYNL